MDLVNESVQKAQKTTSDNADMLQNLLIGLENMGENIKHLVEELETRRNAGFQNATKREYQEMNTELLQEVSLSFAVVSDPIQNFSSPMSMFTLGSSMPSPILQDPRPVLTTPTFVSVPVSQDGELQEMRERISGLHKPYPGARILYSSGIPEGFYFGAR